MINLIIIVMIYCDGWSDVMLIIVMLMIGNNGLMMSINLLLKCNVVFLFKWIIVIVIMVYGNVISLDCVVDKLRCVWVYMKKIIVMFRLLFKIKLFKNVLMNGWLCNIEKLIKGILCWCLMMMNINVVMIKMFR